MCAVTHLKKPVIEGHCQVFKLPEVHRRIIVGVGCGARQGHSQLLQHRTSPAKLGKVLIQLRNGVDGNIFHLPLIDGSVIVGRVAVCHAALAPPSWRLRQQNQWEKRQGDAQKQAQGDAALFLRGVGGFHCGRLRY